MVLTTIRYDSVGGSDSAASGAGPDTAITGTASAHTSGASSTTIEFSNAPDLSMVAADDILWIKDTAGARRMTRITAADDGLDQVTVEDAYNISSGAKVDWAIGGKRKTLIDDTSFPDFKNGKAGWQFSMEGSGTYATGALGLGVCPAVGDTTNGAIELVAAAGATPTVTATGNVPLLTLVGGTHLRLAGFTYTNSTSTADSNRFIRSATATTYVEIENCTVTTSGICVFAGASANLRVMGCTLESTRYHAISVTGLATLQAINNFIHDCGQARAASGYGRGIELKQATAGSTGLIIGNIITGCYESGIDVYADETDVGNLIKNNTIHDNGGDGIYFRNTLAATNRGSIVANAITDNGGYGINVNSSTGGDMCYHVRRNGFRGNTSGESNNLTLDSGSRTLTADPYVDEPGEDFRRNSTAGGGAALQGTGYGYNGP
jgi:hypothetical protein